MHCPTLHHRLRELQFERMAGHKCFMKRVVSICYGLSSTQRRAGDALGTCVHGPAVPPSDFKRSQYVALNWAKWPQPDQVAQMCSDEAP